MKSPEEKVFSLYELTIQIHTKKNAHKFVRNIKKFFFCVHIFRRFVVRKIKRKINRFGV